MLIYIGFVDEENRGYLYTGAPSSGAMTTYTLTALRRLNRCAFINCRYPKWPMLIRSRLLRYTYINLSIVIRSLRHQRRNTTIIAYHSISIIPAVSLLRALGYKVILQLNEIYTNAEAKPNVIKAYLEKKYITQFNRYILSSKLILKKLRLHKNEHLKYTVLPGPLKQLENSTPSEKTPPSQSDALHTKRKLRFVYGGIINDEEKSSAREAILFFQRISEQNDILLDIYGFGTDRAITNLNDMIQAWPHRNITFRGQLPPRQFQADLQDYDIGLALDPKEAAYTATSYPSKILTYLSAGVNVVATPNEAIKDNDIAGLVTTLDVDARKGKFTIEELSLHPRADLYARLAIYEEEVMNSLRVLIRA